MFFHFSLHSATENIAKYEVYVLGTGCTFTSLGLYFARGETTIGNIVDGTTKAVWNSLKQNYMPVPTTQGWKNIATRFSDVWHLPNCRCHRWETYQNSKIPKFWINELLLQRLSFCGSVRML